MPAVLNTVMSSLDSKLTFSLITVKFPLNFLKSWYDTLQFKRNFLSFALSLSLATKCASCFQSPIHSQEDGHDATSPTLKLLSIYAEKVILLPHETTFIKYRKSNYSHKGLFALHATLYHIASRSSTKKINSLRLEWLSEGHLCKYRKDRE